MNGEYGQAHIHIRALKIDSPAEFKMRIRCAHPHATENHLELHMTCISHERNCLATVLRLARQGQWAMMRALWRGSCRGGNLERGKDLP